MTRERMCRLRAMAAIFALVTDRPVDAQGLAARPPGVWRRGCLRHHTTTRRLDDANGVLAQEQSGLAV